jgi:hypothetical protein
VADHEPSENVSEAVPDRGLAFEEKVEKLAKKLLHGGDGNDITDIDAARRSARRMIEESDARTLQATDLDPDDPDVIRRSSSETAAVGDTGPMRRVTEGE